MTAAALKSDLMQGGPALISLVLAGCFLLFSTDNAFAQNRATNELHLQYGNLKNPAFAGGGSTRTFTVTWLHASKWHGLDSFWFVDQINNRLWWRFSRPTYLP